MITILSLVPHFAAPTHAEDRRYLNSFIGVGMHGSPAMKGERPAMPFLRIVSIHGTQGDANDKLHPLLGFDLEVGWISSRTRAEVRLYAGLAKRFGSNSRFAVYTGLGSGYWDRDFSPDFSDTIAEAIYVPLHVEYMMKLGERQALSVRGGWNQAWSSSYDEENRHYPFSIDDPLRPGMGLEVTASLVVLGAEHLGRVRGFRTEMGFRRDYFADLFSVAVGWGG